MLFLHCLLALVVLPPLVLTEVLADESPVIVIVMDPNIVNEDGYPLDVPGRSDYHEINNLSEEKDLKTEFARESLNTKDLCCEETIK